MKTRIEILQGKIRKDKDLILWLSEAAGSSPGAIGNKASRLARLDALDFPVPDGFCISTQAYRRYLEKSNLPDLETLIGSGQFSRIRSNLMGIDFDSGFEREVLGSFKRLVGSSGGKAAVRSSSTAEDQDQYSFAGLYRTTLSVEDEEALFIAVRSCWASYWSDEAVAYREWTGIPHLGHGMAVLVQAMVKPQIAGVLFTRDPVNPQDDQMQVEFVRGQADGLVEGAVTGERISISRDAGRPAPSSPALPHEIHQLMIRLSGYGLRIEEIEGRPQDIEWIVDLEDRLWLLQTRPIPKIPVHPPRSGWNISYNEPFSTLGCELAVLRHQEWVKGINSYYHTNFKPEIEVDRNFIFFKSPWRSPGRLLKLWMRLWEINNWIGAGRTSRRYTDSILPDHQKKTSDLEKIEPENDDTGSLFALFQNAVALYIGLQYRSFPMVKLATMSAGFLQWICRRWFGTNGDADFENLITGLENSSIGREIRLHALIKSLQGKYTGVQLVKYIDEKVGEFDSYRNHGEPDELARFMRSFGYIWADRYPRDPAWKLNGELLRQSILSFSKDLSLSVKHEKHKEIRAETIRSIEERLKDGGRASGRLIAFNYFLRKVEQLYPHKENRNHDVYRSVMVIRKFALALGRRLSALGVIESADDVFFLEYKEVEDAIQNPSGDPDLKRRVHVRRDIYDRSSRSKLQVHDTPQAMSFDDSGAVELSGLPCSRGRASGKARLVRGINDLDRLEEGDILVCSHLRPAWSTAFARISGLLVETGSLLSHGANLARDYDIPAVVNLADVMEIVRDGDQISLDGQSGIVRIQKRAVEV